jgi:hypothetical protein
MVTCPRVLWTKPWEVPSQGFVGVGRRQWWLEATRAGHPAVAHDYEQKGGPATPLRSKHEDDVMNKEVIQLWKMLRDALRWRRAMI